MAVPYPRIYVIVNPGSGRNEPILNVLNDVFRRHDVTWDVGVTHAFGDAERLAEEAAASGQWDLVVGYGGDGTQHEIVKALMPTGMPVGMLPGGTGNGFSTGLGIPRALSGATELLCTSPTLQPVDVAQVGETTFMSRMYTGIEKDEQTSRELKDKFGMLAYGITAIERLGKQQPVVYTITVDDQTVEAVGTRCYVANSGSTGARVSVGDFSPTDGILDVFLLSPDPKAVRAAAARFLKVEGHDAGYLYWRGARVRIDAEPDQPVWADGELVERTPVDVQVHPGAVRVVVPDATATA